MENRDGYSVNTNTDSSFDMLSFALGAVFGIVFTLSMTALFWCFAV